VSALLLLPIVHLFRFLGCDVVFGLHRPPDPAPRQLLQMIVIAPDAGTGPAAVQMKFVTEPGGMEIDESPVDLAPAGTEVDGRLRFNAVQELPAGDYAVTCTMSQPAAITRLGICSGSLNAPGLLVQFNAAIGSPANELQPRFCFEPT